MRTNDNISANNRYQVYWGTISVMAILCLFFFENGHIWKCAPGYECLCFLCARAVCVCVYACVFEEEGHDLCGWWQRCIFLNEKIVVYPDEYSVLLWSTCPYKRDVTWLLSCEQRVHLFRKAFEDGLFFLEHILRARWLSRWSVFLLLTQYWPRFRASAFAIPFFKFYSLSRWPSLSLLHMFDTFSSAFLLHVWSYRIQFTECTDVHDTLYNLFLIFTLS